MKDLKDMLNQIEDDTLPVIMEMFEDAYTSREFPLFAVGETEWHSQDDHSFKHIVLATVENKHYKKWKKERDL